MERDFQENLTQISHGNIDVFRKTTDDFLEKVESGVQEDIQDPKKEAA